MTLRTLLISIIFFTIFAPLGAAAQVSDVLSYVISTDDAPQPEADMCGILDFITDTESAPQPSMLLTGIATVRGSNHAGRRGTITSGFGFRPRFGRMHLGIDISMSVGDTICAPLSGTVDRVLYEPKGYGKYVVLIHPDGMETRYAHLSKALVTTGQKVAAGQPIAISGNTGNSTGPHLHFETRLNGLAVDPRNIFDFTSGHAGIISPGKPGSKPR